MERVSKLILPDVAHRFLFGPTSDYPLARLLIGAVFGAISGTGQNIVLCFASKILSSLAMNFKTNSYDIFLLIIFIALFLGLMYNISLTNFHRVIVGYVFIGMFLLFLVLSYTWFADVKFGLK